MGGKFDALLSRLRIDDSLRKFPDETFLPYPGIPGEVISTEDGKVFIYSDTIDDYIDITSTNDKGWFATELALTTAYPAGQNGRYATVGATDTVRIWDSDTSAWKNSGIAPTTDHSALSNLDYASAGHTGFEPTVTKGNFTETTSAILTITGGTGAIIGSGLTIQVAQAGVATSGYLSTTDRNTFNNKVSFPGFGTDHATAAYGDHNHSGVYEPVLGNPGVDGYVLSSLMDGTRSWIAPFTGYRTQAGGVLSPTTTTDSVNIASGEAYMQNNVNMLRTPPLSTTSVCVGNSGNQTMTGADNFLFGSGSGQSLTTGFQTLAIGNNVLQNITIQNYNMGIGAQAGRYHIGSSGIWIGSWAGRGIPGGTSNGVGNLGIGESVMYVITSGAANTGVGSYSLFNLTSGYDNTGIAKSSGYGLITGIRNTFIGVNSGGNCGSAVNYNVGIGNQTLYNVSGRGNLAGGYQAGYNAGWYGVYLGYQAGYFETGDYKLYIASSNTTTPLIYGEFPNTLLRANATFEAQNTNPITDNTYYLGKNSISSPQAWKAVCVKDTTNGNYYRIEVISGVLTATQIT